MWVRLYATNLVNLTIWGVHLSAILTNSNALMVSSYLTLVGCVWLSILLIKFLIKKEAEREARLLSRMGVGP